MLKFLKKLNPFNWLENFVIKRMVKKMTKAFPSLKEKGLKLYEENKEEVFQKINVVLLETLQKYKSKK